MILKFLSMRLDLNHKTILSRLIFITSCVYLILAFAHLLSARPFWMDEGFVMQSVLNYDLKDFFGVLQVEQAFPRVHLVCVWFLGKTFGFDPIVMRLFSFAFMVSAFFVWMQIFKKTTDNLFEQFLLCFLMSASMCFVYYAAELKPYSADVFMTGIICWICVCFDQIVKRPVLKYVVAVCSVLSIFFSYMALLFFWMIPYKFFRNALKEKAGWGVFTLSTVCCIVGFCVAYAIDIKYSRSATIMYEYFKTYFISTESVGEFFKTFFEGFKKLSVYWMGKDVKWIKRVGIIFVPLYLYGLFGIGFIKAYKERFAIASLGSIGFIVFCELFVLGILKYYPFTGARITFFMAPFVFYLSIKTIAQIKNQKGQFILYGYVLVYAAVCLVNTTLQVIKYYQ